MNIFKKLYQKINVMYVSLIMGMLAAPALAHAADGATDIMSSYRDNLLVSLSGTFLSGGLLDFSNFGLLQAVTALCFIIGIFQVVNNHYPSPSFLMKWLEIPIATFIVMSITGQSTAYQALIHSPAARPTYAGPRTLDTDIYFTLYGIFDEVAQGIRNTYTPQVYQAEYKTLLTSMQGFSSAISNCKLPGSSASCLADEFAKIKSGVDGSTYNNPAQTSQDPTISKDGTSTQNKSPGYFDAITMMANAFVDSFTYITNPSMWPLIIVELLVGLLDIVRLFVNYFTLVAFSLITAMALFFCKLISPFLILPNHRHKVLNAFKMPLSATMYGFVSALIIALGALVIRGVNQAVANTLLTKATSTGIDGADLFQLVIGAALSTSAVLALQIASMKQIPGLCRKLWDLSLTELVEFGKTVVEAGMGVLKVAGVAAGGVALAGVAGIAAGASSAASAAAGSISSGGGAAGLGSAALTGLKSGASRFGSTATNFARQGVGQGYSSEGGLKGLLGLTQTGGSAPGGSSLGGSDSAGSLAGPKGSGGGGGSGDGGGGGSLPPPSSGGGSQLGFNKSKAQTPMNPASLKEEEDAIKNSDPTKSTFKKMAGHLLDAAETTIGTVAGLAGAGMGVAFGHDMDLQGLMQPGVQNLAEHAQNAVSTVKSHQATQAQRKVMSKNLELSRQDKIAAASGNMRPKEEINTTKMKSFAKAAEKGTAFSDADYSQVNKMVTNGDRDSLGEADQKSYDSFVQNMSKNQEYQQWNKKRIDNISDKITSGKASDADIASFNQVAHDGELDSLKSAGILKKNESDTMMSSVKSSQRYKEWEAKRQDLISKASADVLKMEEDGSHSVDYHSSANLLELHNQGYITQDDFKKHPELAKIMDFNNKKVSGHWDGLIKRVEALKAKAQKDNDLSKVFAADAEIKRLQAEKSKRGV